MQLNKNIPVKDLKLNMMHSKFQNILQLKKEISLIAFFKFVRETLDQKVNII